MNLVCKARQHVHNCAPGAPCNHSKMQLPRYVFLLLAEIDFLGFSRARCKGERIDKVIIYLNNYKNSSNSALLVCGMCKFT